MRHRCRDSLQGAGAAGPGQSLAAWRRGCAHLVEPSAGGRESAGCGARRRGGPSSPAIFRDLTTSPRITMLYKLVLPGPIDDLSEVRVLEWHGSPETVFNPGDPPMVELDTHKAVVEMRASSKTVLRRILIAAGEVAASRRTTRHSQRQCRMSRCPIAPEQLAQSSVTYEMV